ncbi:unnamed protein product [Lampetra planeri]
MTAEALPLPLVASVDPDGPDARDAAIGLGHAEWGCLQAEDASLLKLRRRLKGAKGGEDRWGVSSVIFKAGYSSFMGRDSPGSRSLRQTLRFRLGAQGRIVTSERVHLPTDISARATARYDRDDEEEGGMTGVGPQAQQRRVRCRECVNKIGGFARPGPSTNAAKQQRGARREVAQTPSPPLPSSPSFIVADTCLTLVLLPPPPLRRRLLVLRKLLRGVFHVSDAMADVW